MFCYFRPMEMCASSHPQVPIVGVKAFRQAIDATMKGITLEEYAKTRKELAASIKTWDDTFKKGV